MGNENEKMKIMNSHAEKVAEIESMNDQNERNHAIERLARENGYKLDAKKLENYAEEARMRHQQFLKKLENERIHN